jgi:hypothetical protein
LDTLVLNSTSINDETHYVLEAIDFTPPKKLPEWAQSADSDGADLVRTPRYENRTVTMTLRIAPQTTMDLALAKVGELVDLLQECEKNPGGSPLEWSPATSTKAFTLYVLTGEITGIPMVNEGNTAGWYLKTPQVIVALTCKPFGYGAEVEVAAAKSIETGLSTVVLTIPTVAGDVPAEGRLVIKDTAAVGRRFVEWGLEQRYFNIETSLILDNTLMTPVGGAQSEAANAGAYKPGGAAKGTLATTLLPEPTICANTGVLKHVGTFRVKARVQAVIGGEGVASNVHCRLSWRDGEGPLRANVWQTLNLEGKFVEVDLGTITVNPAVIGTQKWLGQVEAYSGNAAAKDVLHIDYLTFIPVLEGYGKARGVQAEQPGTVAAFDNLTTGTLSGSLNARTPALGAAWATSGATTDWVVHEGKVTRSTVSDSEPRYGVFGPALTDSSIAVLAALSMGGPSGIARLGALLRWTNSSNYAYMQAAFYSNGDVSIRLGVKVAGSLTLLASIWPRMSGGSEFVVRGSLVARSDGSLSIGGTINGVPIPPLAASHSALATGGALASGKGGMYDYNSESVAASREVQSVNVAQLGGIPYCIQPSRSMEVRSDSAITADSTGTYYGPVPQYRGSRFFVPQSGEAKRTSRIIVKADRNDLEESDEQTIADAFTAGVRLTPRYVAIPR